ncbi:MAG: iron chelate uptake ABC transporter family permease subunit [Treponema sp.]|jgi:iron complex transport system permease protein|nr:iron chelate uptake ABC transporter family permease subunit [Treponema sp.]
MEKPGAALKRALPLFAVLAALIVLAVFLYIFSRTSIKAARLGMAMTRGAYASIMARTIPSLIGMGLSAALVAVLSLAFQTVTESRVLTPSMIGFDSVFIATQTILVFVFGASNPLFADSALNYLLTSGVMVTVSVAMYGILLRKNKNNIVFLLLFGLIFSGIVRSGVNYIEVLMDPDEFQQVRSATSVTVNNMNTAIIFITAPLMILLTAIMLARSRIYDVMSLGEANAVNLGIAYTTELRLNLLLIAAGMSVVTAMIGSLTFLGLIAVNISRELFKTYRHGILFAGAALTACLILIAGQALVELLEYAVPVTVIIDLGGCSYMFYLILRENRV